MLGKIIGNLKYVSKSLDWIRACWVQTKITCLIDEGMWMGNSYEANRCSLLFG